MNVALCKPWTQEAFLHWVAGVRTAGAALRYPDALIIRDLGTALPVADIHVGIEFDGAPPQA